MTERTWLGRVRISANGDLGQREIILNPRTGEVLRDIIIMSDGSAVPTSVVEMSEGNSGSSRNGQQWRNGSSGGSGGSGGSDDGDDGFDDGSSGSGGSGSGDDGGDDGGDDSGGSGGDGKGGMTTDIRSAALRRVLA